MGSVYGRVQHGRAPHGGTHGVDGSFGSEVIEKLQQIIGEAVVGIVAVDRPAGRTAMSTRVVPDKTSSGESGPVDQAQPFLGLLGPKDAVSVNSEAAAAAIEICEFGTWEPCPPQGAQRPGDVLHARKRKRSHLTSSVSR
jgi:hypothetical protein